jgi:lysyl-tRNA synthetase class 2
VAERFELYAGGLELANGFGELTDPREQERRFTEERARRRAANLNDYPLDHRFLTALAGLAPCAGIALGLDRLLMLLLGANHLDQVSFIPWGEA